jgi:hypothetical protein
MTVDEPMQRLLEYDRRRYWLVNGWSIRFRAAITQLSEVRPHGIKYPSRCMTSTEHVCWAMTMRTVSDGLLHTTIGIDSGEQRSRCRTSSGARTN